MSEAENFNFNLSIDGEESRKLKINRRTTLKNVFEVIDKKTIDNSIKEILKNKAKSYPHQALKMFILNIDRHISAENKKNIKNKVNELEFPE